MLCSARPKTHLFSLCGWLVTQPLWNLNSWGFSSGVDARTTVPACPATSASCCEIGAIDRTDRLNGWQSCVGQMDCQRKQGGDGWEEGKRDIREHHRGGIQGRKMKKWWTALVATVSLSLTGPVSHYLVIFFHHCWLLSNLGTITRPALWVKQFSHQS